MKLDKSNVATRTEPHLRILVLEDEVLIAMHLQEELENAGYGVIGPATSIAEAKELFSKGQIDLAILDANINGTAPKDLVELISNQGVPFIYISGYDQSFIRNNLPEAPILSKPLDMTSFNRVIQKLDLIQT